jgi:hypothetical protein
MCFTLGWFEQLLIWFVIVAAIVALLRLLVPWIAGEIGIPLLAQALNIVLWAVIAVMAIYIIFALISCLLSMGGGFPLLPRSR